MMKMRLSLGALILAGCTVMPQEPSGHALLGIAEFQTTETDTLTTIVGVDAQGATVGRLELFHGVFEMSEQWREAPERLNPWVDGRKFRMDVRGQTLVWETPGYGNNTSMPAPSSSLWAIRAFVADPHVKSVLLDWNIGFRRFDVLPPSE